MDKGLVFFTLALACFWLIVDDIQGGKRISKIAAALTPDLPGVGEIIKDKATDVYNGANDLADGTSDLLPKVPNPTDPNPKKDQAIDLLPPGRQNQSKRNDKK